MFAAPDPLNHPDIRSAGWLPPSLPPASCLDCGASIDGTHGRRERCRPCAKQRKLNRKQTDEYKAQQREYASRVRQTEEFQSYIRAYRQRPEVKDRDRERSRKQGQTEERREYVRLYMQRPEVKAAMRERNRVRNQRPDVKLKAKEKQQTLEYKAHRKRYGREYQQRPEVKERRREWSVVYGQLPHVKDKARERTRLRKPWADTVTAEAVSAMLESQRGRCASCKTGIRDGYHMDHIMPLARGGPSTLENLQLLCAPCNWSKNAKDPYEFAMERGRLF